MVPNCTHLKTDNQTQLNPKLDDTSVDKPIKKVITLKNLLTHILVNLDSQTQTQPNLNHEKNKEQTELSSKILMMIMSKTTTKLLDNMPPFSRNASSSMLRRTTNRKHQNKHEKSNSKLSIVSKIAKHL